MKKITARGLMLSFCLFLTLVFGLAFNASASSKYDDANKYYTVSNKVVQDNEYVRVTISGTNLNLSVEMRFITRRGHFDSCCVPNPLR